MRAMSGFLLASLLLLTACSRETPPPASAEPELASLASVAQAGAAVPVSAVAVSAPEAAAEMTPPPGEPPEEVLRKLEFQRYEEIEKAGGLPVTITASGRQLVLKPKLYSVRKESCKPTPQAPAGWYECSLIISLSLAEDGSDPSEQGERIGVKWDGGRKEWVLQ